MAQNLGYFQELLREAQEFKQALIDTKQEIATELSKEMQKDASKKAKEIINEEFYGHYQPADDHYKRLYTLNNAVNIKTIDNPDSYGLVSPDDEVWFTAEELNGHRASNEYILQNSFYEGYHGGPVYGITLKDKNGNNYWTSKLNGKRVSAGNAGDEGLPPIMDVPLAELIPDEVEKMLDRNNNKYIKKEEEIMEKRLSKYF